MHGCKHYWHRSLQPCTPQHLTDSLYLLRCLCWQDQQQLQQLHDPPGLQVTCPALLTPLQQQPHHTRLVVGRLWPLLQAPRWCGPCRCSSGR